MTVDALICGPGAWLSTGPQSGIVISNRVRLARNLQGRPFPGWDDASQEGSIWRALCPTVLGLSAMPGAEAFEMEALDEVDRQVLTERHLISQELAQKGAGSGVVVTPDETLAVMLNEEDHLRMQAMSPGSDLFRSWRMIDAADSEIEAQVDYAFSSRLGYLTACPSNVGTGLRASVMLHLPGLVLMNEIDPIMRGLNKIGLTVRGWSGEGTEASGNIFQVSNQTTLGSTEQGIIERLTRIVGEVIQHEQNARARLWEGRKAIVQDYVGRAFGILSHAHILSSKEALYLLSGLRLGMEFGILRNVKEEIINEVMLLTQPGHLQKVEGRQLNTSERDEVRAWIVKSKLAGVQMVKGDHE